MESQEEEDEARKKKLTMVNKRFTKSLQECRDSKTEKESYMASDNIYVYMERNRLMHNTDSVIITAAWCFRVTYGQQCDDGDIIQRFDGTANRLTLTGPC